MKSISFFSILLLLPSLALAEGRIQSGMINASALGVSKRFNIYLPDGYHKSDQRYPVIYLVHGWGVNEDSWRSPTLQIQQAADELNLQAIIVMPDGDRGVFVNSVTAADYQACIDKAAPVRNKHEPRESFCVHHADYESYMLEDIIPYIDRTYRTNSTRLARAIVGESAGGLASFHLALRHKDLFSSVAAHSGAVSMLYQPQDGSMLTRIEPRPGFAEWEAMFGLNIEGWKQYDPYSLLNTLKPGELAIYFDSGTDDEFGFYQMALHFQQRLTELGLKHRFVSVPGGRHDDTFFGSRIPVSLTFFAEHFKQHGVYPASE
ncbi:alpha/beta hydrolase [Oceanospirillum sediminis]|uniref:Prolyl oligopeptidase family serine peptidase n=1 Tax=Oceanospirillum sediminis TaxID=2760088 RepID=A0A839IS09_9GAMM|nr:alpha/beta hydrolase-fold protein [Oceanospirillum sediminis]MBB1487332.1 prolyl oligopeptidase family serine peptidase [Oceanospirillum sediminis]